MNKRAIALAGITAIAFSGLSASAATKPKPVPAVCNLITDDKGDSSTLIASEDGLDIVSADIATNAKNLTAVIRLAGAPAAQPDTEAPEGKDYYVDFAVPGAANPLYLHGSMDITGAWSYGWGEIQPSVNGTTRQDIAGTVTGAIASNVMTMTIGLDVLGAKAAVKPKTILSGLHAETTLFLGVPTVGGSIPTADEAESAKTYVSGAKSCVAVPA